MKTKDVLVAARKKIERPECWVKGAFAKNASGIEVSGPHPDAICWCVFGAAQSVIGGFLEDSAEGMRVFDTMLATGLVPRFNDDPATTHADVLALFDRAIAACKEE